MVESVATETRTQERMKFMEYDGVRELSEEDMQRQRQDLEQTAVFKVLSCMLSQSIRVRGITALEADRECDKPTSNFFLLLSL